MDEKDLRIQELKAENGKLREKLEELKQSKKAIDTERLTIEYDGQYVPKELCTIDRLGGADDCEPCHEDCNKECSKCAVQKCFDKLAEYENLEEKGRLLIPQCGEGDTLYEIHPLTGHITERLITAVRIIRSPNFMILYENGTYPIIADCLDKTVFLTEQEAQAALEKMKGE